MSLKIKVFVGEINNLTDARYCAGMGVEGLSFILDDSLPSHITSDKFKQISGWITGVKCIGEFNSNNLVTVNTQSQLLNLDYIIINSLGFTPEDLQNIICPIILKLNTTSFLTLDEVEEVLNNYQDYVSYFLLSIDLLGDQTINLEQLASWSNDYKILMHSTFNKDNIDLIDKINPSGIYLKGGNEIRPGLSSLESISEILELLELD